MVKTEDPSNSTKEDKRKEINYPTPSTAFLQFDSETSLSTAEMEGDHMKFPSAQPAAESLYKTKDFLVSKKLGEFYKDGGMSPTYMILTKSVILVLGFVAFYYLKNTSARGIGATDIRTCLYDRSIELYNNANYVMRSTENVWIKHGLMILSSELIDMLFLSICVIW